MNACRSCGFRELHDQLPLVSGDGGSSNGGEEQWLVGKWITAKNPAKRRKTVLDDLHHRATRTKVPRSAAPAMLAIRRTPLAWPCASLREVHDAPLLANGLRSNIFCFSFYSKHYLN
jgi:hypothetical protein